MVHRFNALASWDLLNALPDAVIAFNEAGVIHIANERAATLFNGTIEDLLGRSLQDLALPEYRASSFGQDQPHVTFATLTTLTGEPFSAWVRSAPLEDGALQAMSIREFPGNHSETIDPEMSVLETLSEGVLITDRSGFVRYGNLAAKRMIGLNDDVPISTDVRKLLTSNPLSNDHDFIDSTLSDGVALQQYGAWLQSEGRPSIPVTINTMALISLDQTPNGSVISFQDVSRQSDAELQVSIQKRVLDLTAACRPLEESGALIVRYLQQMLPGTRAAIVQFERDSRQPSVVTAPDLPEPVLELLARSFDDPDSAPGIETLRSLEPIMRSTRRSNEPHDAFDASLGASGFQSLWCYPVDSIARQNVGVICLYHDCSSTPDEESRTLIDTASGMLKIALDRVTIEQDLRHQSFNDDLTGLPNRILLLDRLDTALQRAAKSDHHVALLLIDIDQFHIVNNNLGHLAGDVFLQKVAERLRTSVRSDDLVARYMGDSFAILLDHVGSEADAVNVVMRIQRIFATPLTISDVDLYATIGIGIALAPDSETDADTLVRYADIALGRAKEIGRGQFAIFSDHQDLSGIPAIELQTRLHRALAAEALDLHFQPVMSLPDQRVSGYEALVRWNDSDYGNVAPDTFLPLAKQSGIMSEITSWVLDRAVWQLCEWRASYDHELFCSVNISPEEVRDPLLVEQVEAVINRYEVEPRLLILEMTEHALIDVNGSSSQTLGRLRELGVQIALDDFGTGFSSLAYLEHLPIDIIKIDGAFIHAARGGATRAPVATAMVELARTLGMVSVAEGIETEEDQRIARQIGCDFGQGYFYGRPQPGSGVRPGSV